MGVRIGIIPHFSAKENRYTLHAANIVAIERFGGIPFIIPYVMNKQIIKKMMLSLDGLYLTGGGDIDPALFQEEPHPSLRTYERKRDMFELQCIRTIRAQKKPIFAVCRGMQMLNIALGGSVYQDIALSHLAEKIQHEQTILKQYPSHGIKVKANSLLASVLGEANIAVNSLHHQVIHRLGKNLTIAALAPDGVIEAIESKEEPFTLGVQWHPEQLLLENDLPSAQLYQHFIHVCRKGEDNESS